MKIEEKLKNWKSLIEEYIDENLPSLKENPKILNEAIRYAVFSGGKRLRPIIVLTISEIFNLDLKKVLPIACGIELIHNFSLIHDDLPGMDNDDYRRGLPTCHKKFGEGIAILAGDTLLTYGFKFIAEAGNVSLIKDIADAIGGRGMAGGQTLDLIYKYEKITEKERRRINYLKTGKLFEICFKIPFYFKKINAQEKKKIEKIAKDFGIAFQIRDDIEDKEGDVEKLKKELKSLVLRMKKNISSFKEKGEVLLYIVEKIYGEFF
ncbi:MAG: polyprenyl synthetase family protein [Candidatus Omnitrophica bacterium]|nr:polyprenyl synthetase family protein [Candidatus Omnitrophota bacterium]